MYGASDLIGTSIGINMVWFPAICWMARQIHTLHELVILVSFVNIKGGMHDLINKI